LRFHWYECADNTISSTTGDTLFMASAVYDWRGSEGADAWYEITDPFEGFPGYGGPPDSCLEGESPDKPAPIRCLEFYNGGIDIICSDSIDARGDINLDGLPYTISDAVMFSNYFVHGLSAFVDVQQTNMYGFAPGYEGSIAATDVNADGIPLSVSDLVYLIRVIVGDAAAYPKVTPVHVDLQSDGGVLSVSEDMGAAYVVVAGDVTPHLLADRVEMKHNFDGERTHVLVYSLDGLSFSGRFLEVDGPIVTIEMATAKGQPATINLVPVTFELGQNFPNPFNPTTQIEFNLPEAAQVNLTVFNVRGQKVTTLVDGYLDAGPHTVTWDAGDNASGMYFYRLQAGDFVQSKKMLLLK
jgi:hypothetical protein